MNKPTSVLHYHKPSPEVGFATSFLKAAALPEVSPFDLEHFHSLEEKFPELKALPDIRSKIAFIQRRRNEIMRELNRDEKGTHAKLGKLQTLRAHHDRIEGMEKWADAGLQIEKPDGPSFRILRKAVASGNTIYFDRDLYAETPSHELEKEVFRFAEIMVVEHDWASAFKDASLDDATVKLPYDVCAFEFKFSGRAVVALATQLETDIMFTPAIQCGDYWALFGSVFSIGCGKPSVKTWVKVAGIDCLMEACASQIRAACIALDADVARSEAVREPYVGGHGRNTHLPPRPYHIVSLSRRSARALPSTSSTETGRRVRLHFRRGHWRHFEDHKTWIKWMLVGDPDLGFVEKHYRL